MYIGASPARSQFVKELANCGYEMTLIEAWYPNISHYMNDKRFAQFLHCDVREIDKYSQLREHDVMFWWHGPEHLEDYEIPETLKKLEALTTGLIVLGAPWGDYPQDEVDGNKFEIHKTMMRPELLEVLGYNVDTIGKVDVVNENNLLAWKEIK